MGPSLEIPPPPARPTPGDRIASTAVRERDFVDDVREGALQRVPTVDPLLKYQAEFEQFPPRRKAAPDESAVAAKALADRRMVSPATASTLWR